MLLFFLNKIQTWSYRGVLHGLELGSALSGWLELRGKLSPCGGEGLVHISVYSLENVSKPPERGSEMDQITWQHRNESMFLNTGVQKGDNCSLGYFGTLFTPDQLVRWQLESTFVALVAPGYRKVVCSLFKTVEPSCFLPLRIKSLTPRGSRHRAVTASSNVPSFFAWLKSKLRSSSSTTDWYSPERSRFLVSSLGMMCSSPSPPLALLRTIVLNRTFAEPDMWDELKDRKERQSSTRQPRTPSSSRARRDEQSIVGTSMMTIVGRRDRNEKSKYIKFLKEEFSLSRKIVSPRLKT